MGGKPLGIRKEMVFSINKNVVPIVSATANDNGAYHDNGNNGTTKKLFCYKVDATMGETFTSTVHRDKGENLYCNLQEARGYFHVVCS